MIKYQSSLALEQRLPDIEAVRTLHRKILKQIDDSDASLSEQQRYFGHIIRKSMAGLQEHVQAAIKYHIEKASNTHTACKANELRLGLQIRKQAGEIQTLLDNNTKLTDKLRAAKRELGLSEQQVRMLLTDIGRLKVEVQGLRLTVGATKADPYEDAARDEDDKEGQDRWVDIDTIPEDDDGGADSAKGDDRKGVASRERELVALKRMYEEEQLQKRTLLLDCNRHHARVSQVTTLVRALWQQHRNGAPLAVEDVLDALGQVVGDSGDDKGHTPENKTDLLALLSSSEDVAAEPQQQPAGSASYMPVKAAKGASVNRAAATLPQPTGFARRPTSSPAGLQGKIKVDGDVWTDREQLEGKAS
ncbi:hypothetical protein RI367_005418 [Sorochytrium milnesiophthora]